MQIALALRGARSRTTLIMSVGGAKATREGSQRDAPFVSAVRFDDAFRALGSDDTVPERAYATVTVE